METFDKPGLRLLRTEIDEALKAVGAKHGISFNLGNIRYDSFTCKVPLEMKITNAASKQNADDQAKKEFEMYASLYGLKPEDFGQTFKVRNTVYKITGISPNRPKFPINGETLDGKKFKFPESTVKFALAR